MKTKMKIIISLILCVVFTTSIISDSSFADETNDSIEQYLYVEVLPGQNIKEAHRLYDDNPAYETQENEISGQAMYTVLAKENVELNGFTCFGQTGDRLGIGFDKKKGRITYTNVNVFLEDLYGGDVTEIQENVLKEVQQYGELMESDIKDDTETYRFNISINDVPYVLTVYTRWGTEGAETYSEKSLISFNIALSEQTASTTKQTSAPSNSSELTLGEKNALNAAKSYLQFMGFSREGLKRQLVSFDGYTEAQATYAVDNCGADWNEQAYKSAQSYLAFMSFSRDGLIHQLTSFDGYTEEQAIFAVDKLGL